MPHRGLTSADSLRPVLLMFNTSVLLRRLILRVYVTWASSTLLNRVVRHIFPHTLQMLKRHSCSPLHLHTWGSMWRQQWGDNTVPFKLTIGALRLLLLNQEYFWLRFKTIHNVPFKWKKLCNWVVCISPKSWAAPLLDVEIPKNCEVFSVSTILRQVTRLPWSLL